MVRLITISSFKFLVFIFVSNDNESTRGNGEVKKGGCGC